MSEMTLIQIIAAERIAVAVAWVVIGAIGIASFVRLMGRVSRKGDVGWASLALIAAGLLIFQWRGLAGHVPPSGDPMVAIALLSFLLSAIGIFIARGLRAPEGHQRAALLSHAVVLLALLGAGLLSS